MGLPANQLSYAQIVINGRQAAAGGESKACVNVFYYKRTSTVPAIAEANVTAGFAAGMLAALAAAANVRWAATQLLCRFVDDPTRLAVSTASAVVGAIATDPLPQHDTVVMILRTARRGSRGRGAKRFGGANEIDTTGDVLTGAGLVRWQTVQTALATNFNDADGNTWVPQVVSALYSNFKVSPATISAEQVTSVTLLKDINDLNRRKIRSVY